MTFFSITFIFIFPIGIRTRLVVRVVFFYSFFFTFIGHFFMGDWSSMADRN